MNTPPLEKQFSRVLVVDADLARALVDNLVDEGYSPTGCKTIDAAEIQLESAEFPFVILDWELEVERCAELLVDIGKRNPLCRVIVQTTSESPDVAERVAELGAYACTEKSGGIAKVVRTVNCAARDALGEALRRSEQRRDELLDDAGAIVWEAELGSWQFTYVSQQAEGIIGYPVRRWREPDFWINLVHKDDRDFAIRLCLESTRRGEDHEFDYRAIRRDGRVVWLHHVVHIVKGADGEPIKLRGVMFDTTDREKTQAQLDRARDDLRTSEDRYRTIVETTQEWIWEIDLDGICTYSNPAVESILGY